VTRKSRSILAIDALINFTLGILLLIFPDNLVHLLGIPTSQSKFYPGILGSVLIGIGVALSIEYFQKPDGLNGLGLGGAIAINICGALVLAGWLIWGDLQLPVHGVYFLWLLGIGLLGISLVELLIYYKDRKRMKG